MQRSRCFGVDIGLLCPWPDYPASTGLISDSCSSASGFASDFLQTPARSGRPCLQLTVPTTTARRGLSPPRFTPCLAHIKRANPVEEFALMISKNPIFLEFCRVLINSIDLSDITVQDFSPIYGCSRRLLLQFLA